MSQVNIYEAKTRLSQLIEQALAGEQVTIAKAGKPQVKLVPAIDPDDSEIVLGGQKDGAKMLDNFDDPLPEFEPYS